LPMEPAGPDPVQEARHAVREAAPVHQTVELMRHRQRGSLRCAGMTAAERDHDPHPAVPESGHRLGVLGAPSA